MIINDLQFARCLLSQELDLRDEVVQSILSIPITINHSGKTDEMHIKNGIIYSRPSSITMFLFKVLEYALSKHTIEAVQKDAVGLSLFYMCKKYTRHDKKQPIRVPALISSEKILSVSTIINNLLKPLFGNITMIPVLYASSPYHDCCQIIETSQDLDTDIFKDYKIPYNSFPIVLCNYNINNKAAQEADILAKILEISFGDKYRGIIKTILMGEEGISESVIDIIKLSGMGEDFVDFLMCLESNINLSEDEQSVMVEAQARTIESDKYLSKLVKVSQQSQQATNQWSQWSVLMGLIEKQLEPMRGSMWPTTENMKPHEDRLRMLIHKKNDGGYHTFEKMLEAARDMYGHKAIEPGKLLETVLKENRIWKM